MKNCITDERTGISYTLVGNVYIPKLVSTDASYEIGRWGKQRKEYIKQNKPVFYSMLVTQCKLNSYLHDIDIRASDMYDTLVKQLAEREGITEQFKANDMMAWVQAMNNISNRAKGIVYNDIIFNLE